MGKGINKEGGEKGRGQEGEREGGGSGGRGGSGEKRGSLWVGREGRDVNERGGGAR